MNELKIMQLQHEINTWKRMLSFMQEENIHLKNRLSAVLKDRFNKSLLEEVEVFQTNFIKADEIINNLKKEVAAVEKNVQSNPGGHQQYILSVTQNIDNARKKIDVAERDFTKINIDFNKYLSENI